MGEAGFAFRRPVTGRRHELQRRKNAILAAHGAGRNGKGVAMRWAVACGALAMAGALSGCASPVETAPAAGLAPAVGHGLGSQYGNYAAHVEGEMRGPAGERCVIFNWDRPLMEGLAIRVRSASCESRERPGRMVCTEISRTVLPVAETHLKAE